VGADRFFHDKAGDEFRRVDNAIALTLPCLRRLFTSRFGPQGLNVAYRLFENMTEDRD
jgi:hypothetical protein